MREERFVEAAGSPVIDVCMAISNLLLRRGFLKTSIAADILGFWVTLAKRFIRPGQVLR